jgi:hypothetical protein
VLGEGDRVGKTGEAGQTELRLWNLVAQSSSVVEGGFSAGTRTRTYGENNRASKSKLSRLGEAFLLAQINTANILFAKGKLGFARRGLQSSFPAKQSA